MEPTIQKIHLRSEASSSSMNDLLAYDDEQFVQRAYQVLLGRAPDPEGLGNYVEQLRNGVSKLQIASQLRMSDEGMLRATNCTEFVASSFRVANAGETTTPKIKSLSQLLALHDYAFVQVAFERLLGRDPDSDGSDFYLEQIRIGSSKLGILAQLHYCDEAKNRRENVCEWYAAIASYDGNSIEINRITNVSVTPRASHTVSAAPPLTEFLTCPLREFVVVVFRNILGRNPDEPSLEFYVKRMEDGVSRLVVLAEVSKSEEAREAASFHEGLTTAIRKHRLAQLPWLGWIFRLANDIESEGTAARRLRRMENQIYLLGICSSKNQHLDTLGISATGAPSSELASDGISSNAEISSTEINVVSKPFRAAASVLRTLPFSTHRNHEN